MRLSRRGRALWRETRFELQGPLPKAYGVYRRGYSKKHMSGQKGTPFSNCVTAMAKAATAPSTNPKTVCKTFSKAHVKGQQGTEFSRCVVAAAKVEKDVATS